MSIERFVHLVLGTMTDLRHRDQRGLSQSTENVILLVGAVAIAGLVILAVTNFVKDHLSLVP